MASEEQVKQALTQVIHLPLNIKEDDVKPLGDKYKVGPYYPVFILTDSSGEVINRWTGYTGAARFLREFSKAMKKLTPVRLRLEMFRSQPRHGEALFLAKYHQDISQFVEAAGFYRQAAELSVPPGDYSYQIFENYANAAWNDQISFDEVLPAAQAVIDAPRKNSANIAKTAQLLSKLARRRDATGRIGSYLQAGIDATVGRKDEKGLKMHHDLKADYALYVEHDTARAVALKKLGLGDGWSDDLNTYYPFGSWCYERRINLAEAQRYVQAASERASDGPFKAKHLSLLSNICEARGLSADALRYAEEAVMHDPDNESYTEQLERLRGRRDR